MLNRRALLLSLSIGMPATRAFALQKSSLADPMRLGVDLALAESGLARALEIGFARDTGIALQLIPMPALPMLEALKNGELDIGLANAPEAEERLEHDGLVHDRRPIAGGEFLIVGPAPVRGMPSLLAGLPANDALAALRRLVEVGATSEPRIVVMSAADGSGTNAAEQALWRAARIEPRGVWYVAAAPGRPLIAQARAAGAYAVVERGAWLAANGSQRSGSGASLAVLVDDAAHLAEQVHVMRSFRTSHPAGKLFVNWIAGGRGRRLVAARPGYHNVSTG